MIIDKRKSFKLDIPSAGCEAVDVTWHNKTANTRYSRLFFVKRGSFFISFAEGERMTLRPGYAYLIPSGCPYSYGTEEGAEYIYLHVRLSDFDRIDALSRFKTPNSVPLDIDLDALAGAIKLDTLTAQITIKGVIYRAISELAKRKEGVLDAPAHSPSITAAIEYISSHLSIGLTLREISDAVYTSQSTLTSRFRREMDMSIGEYIDYRVMLRAADELIMTGRSILEISDSLGFCDQFYFSRRFKEKHGMPPREFRKRGING